MAYNTSVMAPFGSAAGAHGEVMLSPITRQLFMAKILL